MKDAIDFKRLFQPRSIAVVGVSNDRTRGATGFLYSLVRMGYPGKIYPVHPEFEEILGIKTYPLVSSIPDPVDYAIIGVPAASVRDVIDDCIQKEVPFAHIYSSGFEEVGTREGAELQRTLVEKASGRIRIIGPNCMGIYHPGARIGFEPEQPVKSGNVGFISQSGGLAGSFIDCVESEEMFVNKLVSVGNACDLTVTDFLAHFSEDPEIEIVGMYLEGLREGEHREFFDVVRKMTPRKPLVLWKSGYTEAGARAARSHTGSMVGRYDMWRSIARQTGIILVNNMEELVDVMSMFKRAPLPEGNSLGIVAFGGGTSVTATDACTAEGLFVPPLEEGIQQKILNFIPEAGTFRTNPVDLTAWIINPHTTRNVGLLVGSDPKIDALLYVLDLDHISKQCVRLGLEEGRLIGGHGKSLLELKKATGKPLVTVLQKMRDDGSLATKMKEHFLEIGIPSFPNIARAAKVLARMHEYRCNLRSII